ncbi:bromodomain-containing protein 4-like [Raphanus sativus]|nr:bromodomain-containing protein 4-like [Raphanus sativus]
MMRKTRQNDSESRRYSPSFDYDVLTKQQALLRLIVLFQELVRKQWRAKMHEKFQLRNPQLLNLCKTIFPNSKNHSSVWNGPHSLFKRPEGSNRTSSFHKAVEALRNSN